ncbi:MAG: ski2-like helicase [Syntrophaceae bacterium PtaU1.Bin231]|nr:MAG: ski2-like helicase [Syntrophaceae bacterium PtaU1.Bin231]
MEHHPRGKSPAKVRRKSPFAGRGRRGKPPSKRSAFHARPAPSAEPRLESVFRRIGRPEPEPFIPDPFQLRAVDAVSRTDCLVSAPTGSGKTWIAEQAIRAVKARGGRAWYASPLKALSNAKWVEFGNIFGEDCVGILTGDTRENTEAPIIVGTTEILRNQLYDAMHEGRDLPFDLVVLDEAHYLGDCDRGVVWEETMIYLPARIHLLMLSATIGNSQEIADWLSGLRGKECVVVQEEKRPIPLYPLFLHPSGRLMPYLEKEKLFGKVAAFLSATGKGGGGRPPHFGGILRTLEMFNLLPAIFFLKSRSDCDAALRSCAAPQEEDDGAFEGDLRDLLQRFPYLEAHKQMGPLRFGRVASHHGGQLPAWKFLVETMMNKGHLRAIFATSTVSAGVNFPARTIVMVNSDLFNGRAFLPLTGTEFHQMLGRAGRRGLDKIGFLVAVPGRFLDIVHVRKLLFRKPEAVESRIRNDFSMALNLLLSQAPEDIRRILANSLATFQSARRSGGRREERAGELWKDFLRHLDFLKNEGFVGADDRLTETGLWASRLRLDQPLLIAECLRRDVFPKDDEGLLAGVLAPFIYDGDQEPWIDRKRISRKLKGAWDNLKTALRPLIRRMESCGFPVRPLYLWTACAVFAWARGKEWDEIVAEIGISEGDLAMLILRTADNLRQLMALKDTHPETAALAGRAREAILREPVAFD